MTRVTANPAVTRVAANPAVRLDRPATPAPAEVRPSGAFEEAAVMEESTADDDRGERPRTATPSGKTRPGTAHPDTRSGNGEAVAGGAAPTPAPKPSKKTKAAPAPAAATPAAPGQTAAASAASQQAAAAFHREDEEEAAPVRHVLRRGQTLYSVARLYGVEVSALMKANGIDNTRHVAANTILVIPLKRPARRAPAVATASIVPVPDAGHKDDAARPDGAARSGDEGDATSGSSSESRGSKKDRNDDAPARVAAAPALAWPIQGLITAPFGRRGREDHHEGIDIDGETGDPIHAAASGTVVFAGVHGDYGRTVVIDHGEGLRTVYAHASKLDVEEGDPVRVGETIGEVGHSGNARGSHLHFEVRRDGQPVNPMPYLRSPDLLTAGVVPAPSHKSKPARSKSARSDK